MKGLILFSILLFSHCHHHDDDVVQPSYDAQLYASFENPPAGTPILTVDQSTKSKVINIEITPSITEQNGRIFFNYPGVTFKQDKNVYTICTVYIKKNMCNVFYRN